MTEYQVTRWRELPSMVTAREGEEVVKAELAGRFQRAIDEAAMRLGDTVLSEPFILEPITEGRLAITGNFTDASARALADLLAKSGGMFEVDGSDK